MGHLGFLCHFLCLFLNNNQKVNSTFGFRFWTFINVHFLEPFGAFEKTQKK